MPLNQYNLNAMVSWQLAATIPNLSSSVQQTSNLSIPSYQSLDLTQWNQTYVVNQTLTPSEVLTVTLGSPLVNLVNEIFTFGHVLQMWVQPTGGSITLTPGTFHWPMDAGSSFTVYDGDILPFAKNAKGAGTAVPSGGTIVFTNNGATVTTLIVQILGSTT
jgi:hypothetical protein